MQRMLATLVIMLLMAASPAASAGQTPSPVTKTAGSANQMPAAQALPGHDYLFIAIFDCSWKNASKGPSEPTTVAQVYQQLQDRTPPVNARIHAEYVETDCARDNWYSDRTHGQSIIEARLAEMYRRLDGQSADWMARDPAGRISLLILGGSWGGLQAAEFSVYVGKKGLRTSDDRLLVPPGQTAQVLAMLDPVGTLPPELHLPDSLLSGVQFTAMDEHRRNFRSVPLIAEGKSTDGRFLGLSVPGAHSDVCGGYQRNGLSIRTANLLIGYLNRLSDEPILKKQLEPTDPGLNVIHRSEQEGT